MSTGQSVPLPTPTGPPIVGVMIDNSDVEIAVLNTIGYWIDMYLGVKERQKDLTVPTYARPESYLASYDADNWPEAQIPAIAVVCPGTVEDMIRTGAGVSAWFEVTVNAIVTGQTEQEVRQVAAAYVSVLAALLEGQSELDAGTGVQFASEVKLQEWKIELPDETNRTLANGAATFHVRVDNIFNPAAAPAPPAIPSATDPGDIPVAVTVGPPVVNGQPNSTALTS